MFETKQIQRMISAFLVMALPHFSAAAQDPPEGVVPTEEAAHGLYAAIWHVGADEAMLLRSDDPPSFVSPNGFRLDDIEVWLEDGALKYLGVFRPSAGQDHPLVGPLLAADFEQAPRPSGFCLAGFEVWEQAGQTFYAGVLAPNPSDPTCESELFETGLSAVEFSTKLQDYAASHHLVDFETVVEQDQLRVSAVWQPGAEVTQPFAILGVNWVTFHEWVHDLTEDGYQLADIDFQFGSLTPQETTRRHVVGGQLRAMLSGVWRPSVGTDWFGADYHWNHLICAHDLLDQGFEDSGIVLNDMGEFTTTCEQGGGGAPAGQTMRLVTIEAYSDIVNQLPEGCFEPSHGAPMHDSGSAGPP